MKIESASKTSEALFAILKIISGYNLHLKIFPWYSLEIETSNLIKEGTNFFLKIVHAFYLEGLIGEEDGESM